ncbi:hypothetical protein KIN20_032256 [Parelaphostrongylus tenuis]|uniref:WW domain-binding protein 4 n=1 Tax=Parelaphostrongylus tenuis TaxID=148309 RepID=A0AAD5WHL5_PARTN|nr:hypothetical protein KIN20_032256 [Parelaphostrongylus tenuis]
MADVWKSQGRKFCEICKVWFGDNRASIEFHERGKKHKEALAAKLRELSRASREKERAQAQMSSALAAMEAAALKAMRENGEGVEHGPALPSTGLASKIFDPRQLKDIGSMAREMAKRKNEVQEVKSQKRVAPSVPCGTPKYFKRELPVPAEYLEANVTIPKQEVGSLPSSHDETVWVEADAGDGRIYYYHMYTGVSQWEQPKSFYTAEEYKKRVLESEFSTSIVGSETVKHEQPSTDTPNNSQPRSVLEEKKTDDSKVKMEPHDEETASASVVDDIPLPDAGSSATDVAVKEEPLELQSDSNEVPVSTPNETCEGPPAVETCHSQMDAQEEERPTPSHGPFGSWQRVGKSDNQPKFSPLTAKYRAEEERERKSREEKEKLAAKGEPKVEFTEKTGAVLTKKVKGPIEFKKRSAAKSVRQRIQ